MIKQQSPAEGPVAGFTKDDLEKRVAGAELLCHLGELSSARQALEGATLAPGNSDTLDQLKDPTRRPPRPREPMPHNVVNHVPGRVFELDEQLLSRNLRSARRGAAAGPSGMTTEHFRLLCSDMRTLHVFFQVAEKFARGEIPASVVKMVKLGRMTALSKPDGGVRGIVTGDVVRRLVARTMAQQLGKAVEAATSPHRYAPSTKAGCECIAHILQGLIDADERATVISVDGVSAFDLMSRGAMMEGLMRVDGGSEAVLFVRMFLWLSVGDLWEDSVHTIRAASQPFLRSCSASLFYAVFLPLHLTVRSCRCGLPLDEFGHHRAACAQAGVLSKRGWALANVVARTCREAGGRVTTNVFMRDLDLGQPDVDGRRLEVIVDGLPLHSGAQLAVDTTLVCALHRDGTPVGCAAQQDGVVLQSARPRKERTYPKLLGGRARSKLVVLAVEVGGRWSEETRMFLSLLARAKVRGENPLLRERVQQAWRLRWGALLSCTNRLQLRPHCWSCREHVAPMGTLQLSMM